jgi:glycosyltransferase involved in cell wall biosynthesis
MNRHEALVVFSHLRWTFVWQRPQHLISRLGRGRTTWFIEEPMVANVNAPRLCTERHDHISRAWLEVPGPDRHVGFDDPAAESYASLLVDRIGLAPDVAWLYTPLALPLASRLRPDLLVYDVMDDLASFRGASPAIQLLQERALAEADVVFTGGRSLFASVASRAGGRAHLFPSGVDPAHYDHPRQPRRDRPVAGYIGVLDERIDLALVAGLAERLPDWDIRMVGPTVKIEPAALPAASNLHYLGQQPYAALPRLMAGFDVGLMPFALNEATRSISPTKTLEYLAAGLPVVSTRVPDVVADHAEIVELRDDAAGFAAACRALHAGELAPSASRARHAIALHTWDAIAERMSVLLHNARAARASGAESPTPATTIGQEGQR